eukprot:EG_transcript_33963
MALQLPHDVWISVADFLQFPYLSHVCRSLRQLLHRRHLIVQTKGDRVAALVDRLREEPWPRSLLLRCHNPGEDGARALAGLAAVPTLEALTLLFPTDLDPLPAGPAEAVAMLRKKVGDAGAEALAALRHCPRLRHLVVELSCNNISDAGVESLSALREAPALEALSLGLAGNHVG